MNIGATYCSCKGLNDILVYAFISCLFCQVIIEVLFTMHKHLDSLSENISDVVGIR